MHTRERILQEALSLFSEKGYEAVSVRDIARAVGVKESSLYNHFKNKRDIFDSIINEFSQRGTEFFERFNIMAADGSFTADSRTVAVYQQMSSEQFETMAGFIFDYYFTDEINVKLRKMLTIEQYRSPEAAKLYRDISFDNSLEYQEKLFAELMKAGSFVQADPQVLALEFFAPIYLIFCKFDNDEQGILRAKELFMRHIRHFNQLYTVQNSSGQSL